jgi:LysM repeat protein
LFSKRLSILSFLLAFFCLSCQGASDEELNRLKAETEALATELGELRREAEILDRALTNVYREKDMTVDRLNSLSGEGGEPPRDLAGMPVYPTISGVAASPADDGLMTGVDAPVAPAPTANRTYVTKRGDTLYQIAAAHDVTMQSVVDLNPFLGKREGYMVWEEETLVMPPPQTPR